MEISYKEVNGYYIPELEYQSAEQLKNVGKYGLMRMDYLRNHKSAKYQFLLLQDKIGEHILLVENTAREREEVIMKQLEKSDPLPDKGTNQMGWVQKMNQHKAIAEEIICKELVYV